MFWKKKKTEEPLYPPEVFEPVIRSSICTGKKLPACATEKAEKSMSLC